MKEYYWSDRYSVGIEELDRQHQRLLAIMAELHAAMLERESKAILADIFEKLIAYTQEHFTYEEKLLKKFDYPAYQDHTRDHEQFSDKVLAMKGDYAANSCRKLLPWGYWPVPYL